jgi:hypothetical protein
MPDSLYNLIYISKAVKLMNNQDLNAIMMESRNWNTNHGITGMLLYIEGELSKKEGRFIQVLEGNQGDVQFIFSNIRNDPRHCNVLLMNESKLAKRNFSSWLMGFKPTAEKYLGNTVGYFDLNDFSLIKMKFKDFNIPFNYLKSFYELHSL